MGRNTEIQQNPIHFFNTFFREKPFHIKEIAFDRSEALPEGREPFPRCRQSVIIPVDSIQSSVFRKSAQHRFGMSAASKRSIDKDSSAFRLQKRQHFFNHDRNVMKFSSFRHETFFFLQKGIVQHYYNVNYTPKTNLCHPSNATDLQHFY